MTALLAGPTGQQMRLPSLDLHALTMIPPVMQAALATIASECALTHAALDMLAFLAST